MGAKEVDTLRLEAIARFDQRGVRLVDELNSMLKLLTFQREALQKSLFSEFGYRQEAVDLKTVQASKELTLAYTRMVEAQIKLDKALKSLADQMTPEEEKETVRKYIRAMTPFDRGRFMDDELQWHRKTTVAGGKFERVFTTRENDNGHD